MGIAYRFVRLWLQCYIQRMEDKGGLQIAASCHYHSQSRGAQERQTHTETQQTGQGRDRTIQVKFTILIFRCLLLSVCLIRLHSEKVAAMGAVLAAESGSHLWCTLVWQWQPQTKPWKSGSSKLPISLISRDIVFSQQSAHPCYISHQLFLKLAKPVSLWRYVVCLLPFLIGPSLSSLNSVTASWYILI